MPGSPRRRGASRRLSACGGSGEDGVERGDEAIVLRRRSDRGPQAPVTPGPNRNVADEDALLQEPRMHVRWLLVPEAEEDEVRHRREHLDRRDPAERSEHAIPLLLRELEPVSDRLLVTRD